MLEQRMFPAPALPQHVRELLTGPCGRAALYVYPEGDGEYRKWVLDLPYVREEQGDLYDDLLTGIYTAFVFDLSRLRDMKGYRAEHENPHTQGQAYSVVVAEIWGDAVTLEDEASWEDYSDGEMNLPGPDWAVAEAHQRVIVEMLLQGTYRLPFGNDTVPTGHSTWEAFWASLYEQAKASL